MQKKQCQKALLFCLNYAILPFRQVPSPCPSAFDRAFVRQANIGPPFSKQKNGAAWTKSFGEMAKKTVLRRLCKHIELDFDSIEQGKVWEETSDMEFKNEPVESEKSEKIGRAHV